MSFPFFIAQRYLFSKKSTNAINVISIISMAGVCIGSAALITILSVFNGFEGLITSLYNRLLPDIEITAAYGKTFDPSSQEILRVTKVKEVAFITKVLQDNALLKYGDRQFFSSVKGVSEGYLKNTHLDDVMVRGEFVLQEDSSRYAVIGRGVEYNLGINTEAAVGQISIFAPKRNTKVSLTNPEQGLKRMEIYPAGVFYAQQDMDEKTVFVSLDVAQNLFEQPVQISSMEMMLKAGENIPAIKLRLREMLGEKYIVKDRFEQNELLYKVMNSEKWAVYLILTFVLIIAVCNIIGSVTMLVIDKKKDIAVLMSMGARQADIRKIFLLEGMVISLIGGIAGLMIGGFFGLLQQQFGLISFGNQGSFIVDAYPVDIQAGDFMLVLATIFVISFLASWFTSSYNVKQTSGFRLEMGE